MRWMWRIGVVLACLVLAACGGGQEDPAPDDAEDAIASPTVAAAEMTIGTIVWSETTDEETGEPVDPVQGFTPRSPAITASIEVENVPAGTEFTATWTLNDQPIEVGAMHVTAETDLDHGWVSFRFVLRDGEQYPTGQLGVVITTNTGALREGSVEIDFP